MIRIARKSKSFSQKKRGYKIIKSKNKFYSLLSQIDAIEKSLKRLKHTLKMYSDAKNNSLLDENVLSLDANNPLLSAIQRIRNYLNQFGNKIKGLANIIGILGLLDKFANKAEHTNNRINIQKSHRRYSGKPSNEIKEAVEGLGQLLKLSPQEIAEAVEGAIEKGQESKIRYNKIQRRNYDSSDSSSVTEKISWWKIIFELSQRRLDEFAIKMSTRVKVTNKMLWISAVGVLVGFILVVVSTAFWPILLFFTIIAALSGISHLVNDFKTANLSQTHKNILSDLNLLSYRMAKSGKNNDVEAKKVVNYILYGNFVENVSQTSEEAQAEPDQKTIAERVKDLLEHYKSNPKFKLE